MDCFLMLPHTQKRWAWFEKVEGNRCTLPYIKSLENIVNKNKLNKQNAKMQYLHKLIHFSKILIMILEKSIHRKFILNSIEAVFSKVSIVKKSFAFLLAGFKLTNEVNKNMTKLKPQPLSTLKNQNFITLKW